MEKEVREIQFEFKKCQDAMTRLARRGYQLSPYIEGEWRRDRITEWRIVPVHSRSDVEMVPEEDGGEGDDMAARTAERKLKDAIEWKNLVSVASDISLP